MSWIAIWKELFAVWFEYGELFIVTISTNITCGVNSIQNNVAYPLGWRIASGFTCVIGLPVTD
jgi:hypothetical protein